MSTAFDVEQQQAFRQAQTALEDLLQLQRQVKTCAEALKGAAHDARRYEQVAQQYVGLLDEWDRANTRYAQANEALLKLLYRE